MIAHRKRQNIDWDKIGERVRVNTMASLGLRRIEIPFRTNSETGAEWETQCQKCGIKIIYCTANQVPDGSIDTCTNCRGDI